MKILALIPARGGSKGVHGKNIRELGAKPLIAWSIESALKSPLVERVIVSTDEPKVAEIAKNYGSEVPFLRPPELAQDDTPDTPVFVHAVSWLKEHERYEPDVMLIFRPTSPFRVEKDIELVVDKMKTKSIDSVRTVKRVHEHPYWMYKYGEHGKAIQFVEGLTYDKYYQRQILPKIYVLNGLLDALRPEIFRSNENPYGENMYLVETPIERSIELDTEEDFLLAEYYLSKNGQG